MASPSTRSTIFKATRAGWGSWLGRGLAIAGCVGAIALLQLPQLQRLRATGAEGGAIADLRRDLAAEQARLELLQRLPSFGFDNLISSWTFLNFLQYFGDSEARQRTDYSLSPAYFEVILRRDPRFLSAYTFLSTSTALYAGMPDRSVALTQAGLQQLTPQVPPGSFFVWRSLGIDQLLFLGDAAAAQQSFATAAQWAAAVGTPEALAVAQSSQQTAAFLANNPNSRSAQVSAWMMVLSNAPDDRTRAIAAQRIEALGGSIIPTPDGSFQIRLPPVD